VGATGWRKRPFELRWYELSNLIKPYERLGEESYFECVGIGTPLKLFSFELANNYDIDFRNTKLDMSQFHFLINRKYRSYRSFNNFILISEYCKVEVEIKTDGNVYFRGLAGDRPMTEASFGVMVGWMKEKYIDFGTLPIYFSGLYKLGKLIVGMTRLCRSSATIVSRYGLSDYDRLPWSRIMYLYLREIFFNLDADREGNEPNVARLVHLGVLPGKRGYARKRRKLIESSLVHNEL